MKNRKFNKNLQEYFKYYIKILLILLRILIYYLKFSEFPSSRYPIFPQNEVSRDDLYPEMCSGSRLGTPLKLSLGHLSRNSFDHEMIREPLTRNLTQTLARSPFSGSADTPHRNVFAVLLLDPSGNGVDLETSSAWHKISECLRCALLDPFRNGVQLETSSAQRVSEFRYHFGMSSRVPVSFREWGCILADGTLLN